MMNLEIGIASINTWGVMSTNFGLPHKPVGSSALGVNVNDTVL